MARQLEVHWPRRRPVVRRRAAFEPDADLALHPTDRQIRSGPDGRQRQPPVRRDRRDLLGAEAGLPVDDQNTALRGQKLTLNRSGPPANQIDLDQRAVGEPSDTDADSWLAGIRSPP